METQPAQLYFLKKVGCRIRTEGNFSNINMFMEITAKRAEIGLEERPKILQKKVHGPGLNRKATI